MVKKVRSTVKPQAVEIDEFSVWIASNVKEVEFEETTEYEFELTQIDKDDYLLMLHEENEKNATSNEIALAELASAVLGGTL